MSTLLPHAISQVFIIDLDKQSRDGGKAAYWHNMQMDIKMQPEH